MATLAMAFGALAAILAAVGLYGTISYSVARRTREFGIRLVLGAAPESLLLFVLREVGWLIGIGVAVGAACQLLAGAACGIAILWGARARSLDAGRRDRVDCDGGSGGRIGARGARDADRAAGCAAV
jgi:hypothetical protein